MSMYFERENIGGKIHLHNVSKTSHHVETVRNTHYHIISYRYVYNQSSMLNLVKSCEGSNV